MNIFLCFVLCFACGIDSNESPKDYGSRLLRLWNFWIIPERSLQPFTTLQNRRESVEFLESSTPSVGILICSLHMHLGLSHAFCPSSYFRKQEFGASCILNKVNFIASVSCHGGVHKPGLELVSRLGSRSFFSEMSADKCVVSEQSNLVHWVSTCFGSD